MDFKSSLFSSSNVCLIISIWMFQLTHGKVPKNQINEGTRSPQRIQAGGGPLKPRENIFIKISDSFNCEELSTIRLGLQYLNCITCLYFTTSPMDEGIASNTINIERYQPDQLKASPTGYSAYIDNITVHSVVREMVLGLNVINNSRSDADEISMPSPPFPYDNSSDTDEILLPSTILPYDSYTDADEINMQSNPFPYDNSTDAEPIAEPLPKNRFNSDKYTSLVEQTFGNGGGMSTIDKLSPTDIDKFDKEYCEIPQPIEVGENCEVVYAAVNYAIGTEIAETDEWYQRYKNDDGEFQEDCLPCSSCDCDLPRFSSVENCRNASGIQLSYIVPSYECGFGECKQCDADPAASWEIACNYAFYFEETQCSENCKLYTCNTISANDKCELVESINSTRLQGFSSFDNCQNAQLAECGYPELYQCIDGNCRLCGFWPGQEVCEKWITPYNGLDNCIAETECKS